MKKKTEKWNNWHQLTFVALFLGVLMVLGWTSNMFEWSSECFVFGVYVKLTVEGVSGWFICCRGGLWLVFNNSEWPRGMEEVASGCVEGGRDGKGFVFSFWFNFNDRRRRPISNHPFLFFIFVFASFSFSFFMLSLSSI